MVVKLCIVAHFDSPNYFQWYVALERYASKLGIIISSVNSSPTYMKVYNDFDKNPYWQPLREADLVFVYATRRSSRNEVSGLSWWTLPKFVKPFMKPTAKMIAQYDDEFMWLFDSKHVWWDVKVMPNPENQGPEQFFKDTNILEIPDAHLTVTNNPPFAKYTTKPVFKILLPQLFRYNFQKYSEEHKGKNIAMLLHSIREASVHNTLENIIRPMNYSVCIFSGTLDRKRVEEFRNVEKLPPNSVAYERLEYDSYEDLLWQNCSIGLDDNTDYHGWSRFVMECALAYIPCVGSSEAVQDIFPELYTISQDYAKQIELIEQLKTDKKFYHKMAKLGHDRIIELIDDERLCRALLDIFTKIGASPSQLTLNDIPTAPSNYVPDKHQAQPHPRKSDKVVKSSDLCGSS